MSDRGNKWLRLGDRYLGIPIVCLLGLFVRKKKRPNNFKKVGFLATAAIGDTILISPVIKEFRSTYPDAEITIYCGKSNRSTFEMVLPDFNLVTIPVGNPLKAIQIIRKQSFDCFFDLGPWPRINALLSFFSRANYKVGFKSINQHRHFVYNAVIEHKNNCHELDNLRRLVSGFVNEQKTTPFMGERTPNKKQPYVVVHMFPSGYKKHYKEWSDCNWVKLLDGLTAKGIKVVLTGAPVDLEASERIVSKCSNSSLIELMAGKTNLQQAGEIVQNAIVVISVNTGIMHMAAAYNQRVVALHGPTSPLRWGPVCTDKVDFVATTKGAGCLHLGFEYVLDDENSLDSINPELVLKESIKLYKEVIC